MKKMYAWLLGSFLCVASYAQENFPSVSVKTLGGQSVDFSKLVSGSGDTAVVVSFWATWCVPCVTELDNINDVFADWQKEKPFKLLAISIDDARTSQRVKTFVKGKGWGFDVLTDVNNDLKRALNINDVPHVLIIKNNKVVYQHTGYVAGNEDELFTKIKTL
ncbi:Thiol-disulfide isomerase or thioredoxin [Filimonas lacunae]|uniref:Thiol-disulfide isomerase or thioredoxin n=1 Tax=Filimonas lacunae TaxID=477680 RepID=A0A173MJL5_9BACT|nr:TlpA disulfide reductase family protein [Filimonas lacunae]BAV07669.1 related to cytochrome c biogenesis protein TlpA [Filimonas lacunae]SIT03283.1 Thiol-disulfide isomerase or thioredoxin [Filimonas lacunae]